MKNRVLFAAMIIGSVQNHEIETLFTNWFMLMESNWCLMYTISDAHRPNTIFCARLVLKDMKKKRFVQFQNFDQMQYNPSTLRVWRKVKHMQYVHCSINIVYAFKVLLLN